MTQNRFAIAMLCMLTDHYVLGALIAAYAHRQFIKLNNLDIDLVIMCDEYLYNKYKDALSVQFDKVVKIELHYFKHIHVYNMGSEKKYGSWIGYSTNKWQCLRLDEYEKVLFIDIDIMPVDVHFYNIFNMNTPGFHMHYSLDERKYKKNNCVDGSLVSDPLKNVLSYSDYVKNYLISLDGGCVLVKPDKAIYDKYINYLNDIFKDGMFFMEASGGDETSLFYFYTKYLPEKRFYNICDRYVVIPWENYLEIKNPYGYNFLSYIKPWLKPKFLMWKEERIWRNLYDRMEKNDDIRYLFRNILMKGYRDFVEIKPYYQNKWYYTGYISKHPYLYTLSTFDEIISHEKEVNFPKGDYGTLEIKKY